MCSMPRQRKSSRIRSTPPMMTSTRFSLIPASLLRCEDVRAPSTTSQSSSSSARENARSVSSPLVKGALPGAAPLSASLPLPLPPPCLLLPPPPLPPLSCCRCRISFIMTAMVAAEPLEPTTTSNEPASSTMLRRFASSSAFATAVRVSRTRSSTMVYEHPASSERSCSPTHSSVRPTCPSRREAVSRASPRCPRTSSVDPPPMSMHSARCSCTGNACRTPLYMRRASSWPLMTSTSTPVASDTCRTKTSRLCASRTAEVATARSCAPFASAARWKRWMAASARCSPAGVTTLKPPVPPPRRTGSFS
mmetsp:Transcript_8388/g.34042  ORF Transcript_8388/g.34042 Transcript_8388/m.34042 type:complete len:307 (-) Transcript_8388:263-1183(-)